MSEKIHLVFDIDMTLVLSVSCTFNEETGAAECKERKMSIFFSPRRRSAHVSTFKSDYFDLKNFGMRVHIRPAAISLLNEISKHPDILTASIWSAGVPEYVRAIARELSKRSGCNFEIVWARDKCEKDENGELYKPLEKMAQSPEGVVLGMNPDASNVVLIDDLDLNLQMNPDKVYKIPEYNRVNRFDYAINRLAHSLFGLVDNIRENSRANEYTYVVPKNVRYARLDD